MPLNKDINNALDPLLAAFSDDLDVRLNGFMATAYLKGRAEMITWGKTKGGIPIAYEGPPISAAVDYAKTQAAQLVTQMNTETQRRLALSISKGIQTKQGIPKLASEIRRDFADMTKYRSELIARTETADALSQASLNGMADMGITGKEWVTVGDSDVSDECMGNEAEGVIPVNQTFSGGVDDPPQHPDCRCSLAPAKL